MIPSSKIGYGQETVNASGYHVGISLPAIPGFVAVAKTVVFGLAGIEVNAAAGGGALAMGWAFADLAPTGPGSILGPDIKSDVWARCALTPLVLTGLRIPLIGKQYWLCYNNIGATRYAYSDVYFDWENISIVEWEEIARRQYPEGVP